MSLLTVILMRALLCFLLVPLLLLSTGCTNARHLTGLVKELKNDPATVSVVVTTIYGTIKFARTNPGTNTTTTVTPDGTVTVTRSDK